jgi:hypothetical protein
LAMMEPPSSSHGDAWEVARVAGKEPGGHGEWPPGLDQNFTPAVTP